MTYGLQVDELCCGVEDGESDWSAVSPGSTAGAVPDTCCQLQTEGCGLDPRTTDLHTDGCLRRLEKKVSRVFHALAMATLLANLLQVTVLACFWKQRRVTAQEARSAASANQEELQRLAQSPTNRGESFYLT